MSTCTVRSCIQMPSTLAMTRIKTRVDFNLPALARSFGTNNLTASIKIDEVGNLTVLSMNGGNTMAREAIKTALEQWKFYPAIVQNEARCVETELPFLVGR